MTTLLCAGPCAVRWLAALLVQGGAASVRGYIFAHPPQVRGAQAGTIMRCTNSPVNRVHVTCAGAGGRRRQCAWTGPGERARAARKRDQARGEGWGSHAVADPSDSTPGRHSYVFGNVTRAVVGEYALSTLMASYWVAFGAWWRAVALGCACVWE